MSKRATEAFPVEFRAGDPSQRTTLFTEGYNAGDFLTYVDGTNTLTYAEGLAGMYGHADFRIVTGNAITTQSGLGTAGQTAGKTLSNYDWELEARVATQLVGVSNMSYVVGAYTPLAIAGAPNVGIPTNCVGFVLLPGTSYWEIVISDGFTGASGNVFRQSTNLSVTATNILGIYPDSNGYVEFVANGVSLLRTRQFLPSGTVKIGAGGFVHTGVAGGNNSMYLDYMRLRMKVNR